MAQLPRFDPAEVATNSDLDALRSDFTELRTELRAELRDGLAIVNERLDRLFQTLLVGMFGVVAVLIGVIFRIG